MFVDDVMGRSCKHPSCVLHFSSPIDPLAHISADFPSLAQRDVKRPTSPPATCVKIWKVFWKHVFSLRLFVFQYLFHISPRIPFSYDISPYQGVKYFTTFRKYIAFIFRGLRGPIGSVVSNIHMYSIHSCRFQAVDFGILAVTENLSIWIQFLIWILKDKPVLVGDRGGSVVKVPCYKSEGCYFDSGWCHWNF